MNDIESLKTELVNEITEKERVKDLWNNINGEVKLLGAVIKNLDSTKIMSKPFLVNVYRRLNNIVELCGNEENQKINNIDYSDDFKSSLQDVRNNFWALRNSLDLDQIKNVEELEKQYLELSSGGAFLGLANLVKTISA